MKKIDLMIIGAQKAGTTSLKNYLYQHPQIVSHYQTEFSYFFDAKEYKKGYNHTFKKYISKSDISNDFKLITKFAGLYTSEKALMRLKEHNPDVTLVFILRNPVERAYSAYNMERAFNTDWMRTDFEGLLNVIEKKEFNHPMYKLFIKMGLYSEYLETIYKYFTKEQVKIYLFEELKENPLKICAELFEILGVNKDFVPDVSIIHNKSAIPKNSMVARIIENLRQNDNQLKRLAKNILPYDTFTKLGYQLIEFNKSTKKLIEPLSQETRAKYESFFKPYNTKLEKMTGIDFSIWNKNNS